MIRSSFARFALLFAMLTAAGCDGFLTPRSVVEVDGGDLTIVHVAPDAPPIEETEITFWMVRGEEHVVEIRYMGVDGYNGKCLRLVIPAEAPLRDAEGRAIEQGDSVEVTVRVVDSDRFLFELEPAGLTLNPAHPATLEIRYRWLSEDANGDGRIDSEDDRLVGQFGLWAQTPGSSGWTSIPSTRVSESNEVHARISVFTRYALASD